MATDPGLDAALDALEARLRGRCIRPGADRYDEARGVHNTLIDRRPVAVVQVADAADIAHAIELGRAAALPLAIRSGGHSIAGHGVVDGGIVIDLSLLRNLRIDAAGRRAIVQPGLTAGALTGALHEHGLAVPLGDTTSVGLGGLTLGGGVGWLVRKHGLTIDSLESVELVAGDGSILTASERTNADLYWALRGGGGNFGVATRFEYRLHPVGTVLGGAVVVPATADVLRGLVAAAADAPDELTVIAQVMHAPPAPFIPAESVGRPVIVAMVVYAGDPEDGLRAVAPLRAVAEPVVDIIRPMAYPDIYQLTEPATARGPLAFRSTYLDSIDGAAETIVEHLDAAPGGVAMTQVRILGGAVGRVPADATAYAFRDRPLMVAVINPYREPADAPRQRAWLEAYWDELRPFGRGVLSSFLGDEGDDRVREAYPGATYDRLAEVKRRYDPDNCFRLNQNIHPAP